MDATEKKLSYEQVKNLLDNRYELIYIDYRDNFDDDPEGIQKAIQAQDEFLLEENLYENWLMDAQDESIDYIFKELKKTISNDFELEEEEAEDIIETYWEDLRQEIQERDISNPIHDLLRNTDDPVCFYDTGIELFEGYDEADLKNAIRLVKKTLKIKTKKYDTRISIMLQQASYGGLLVVYFRKDAEELMNIGEANTITFKNPMIAVIDMVNGSGDHTDLEGHQFSLPFTPKNIFVDKTFKYSYTFSVCGMYSNWCDCTDVSFSNTKSKREIETSALHAHQEREEELDRIFKSGKCTAGDMDMKRHRRTIYINDFPCGTHCKDCGTFWIDQPIYPINNPLQPSGGYFIYSTIIISSGQSNLS